METQKPEENKPKPLILPKLRKGITLAFEDFDSSGKPHWLLHDEARNKFFLIGWPEYQMLEHWELGNSDAVIEAISQNTTLHIDLPEIESFVRFLKNNYLIQQRGYDIHQLGKEQKLFKTDNWLSWLIGYYLFFRIPLWLPDKFLTRTQRYGCMVFNPYLGYVMTVLGCIALFQIGSQWTTFTHTFPTVFTWNGLLFSMIAFLFCKFCHELGHAYMCKRYGVPVPTLGVAFLVFWPVLYTDTTLSWKLNSKKRMKIALAGIWVETYVVIFAALIWCNSSNLTLQAICYVTITVNWMASLLINVSPFMRFDGYYVLADYLKMPNLQPRAFALARWQIRHWLFNLPEPVPEVFTRRRHILLVAYSITTWLYRLTLYIGIAALVYHFFIKIVGIILFIIEVYFFILGPFVSEIRTWVGLKKEFTWNTHTIVTTAVFVMLLLILLIPAQESIKLPGTLSYNHEFLVAPVEGVIENDLPPVGTVFKAGQTIVKIRSPDLESALNLVILDYKRKLNELRRAHINKQYSDESNVILSEINKSQSEYKKLYSLQQKLILKVPFDGVLYEVAPDISAGTTVRKDEWIADIIQPNVIQVEAYVSESDLRLIKNNAAGYFYPHSLSDPRVAVTLVSIDKLNTNQLNCQYSSTVKQDKKQDTVIDTPCYNANELGGEIATYLADDGTFVPVESVYRVLLKPNKQVQIDHIQRGTVVLSIPSESYAEHAFYWVKKILVQQSGF